MTKASDLAGSPPESTLGWKTRKRGFEGAVERGLFDDPAFSTRAQDRAQLSQQMGWFAGALKKYGEASGTGHKRVLIPKSIIDEEELGQLGFIGVDIAVPEAGQETSMSYRHPDTTYHLHDFEDNWTMHKDRHHSSTMLAHGEESFLDKGTEYIKGIPHIVTEGLPGMYYWLRGKMTGVASMEDRLKQELPIEYMEMTGLSRDGIAENTRRDLTSGSTIAGVIIGMLAGTGAGLGMSKLFNTSSLDKDLEKYPRLAAIRKLGEKHGMRMVSPGLAENFGNTAVPFRELSFSKKIKRLQSTFLWREMNPTGSVMDVHDFKGPILFHTTDAYSEKFKPPKGMSLNWGEWDIGNDKLVTYKMLERKGKADLHAKTIWARDFYAKDARSPVDLSETGKKFFGEVGGDIDKLILKKNVEARGKGVWLDLANIDNELARQVFMDKDNYLFQQKLDLAEEFRVVTVGGKPVHTTYRFGSPKTREAAKKLGFQSMKDVVDKSVFTKSPFEVIEPVLDQDLKSRLEAFTTKASKELPLDVAAYDIALTKSGKFKIIEAQRVFGNLNNPVVNRRVQQAITGRRSKLGMAAVGLTAGIAAVLGYNMFSGADDEYNTIEGLPHGGMAETTRKTLTEFGSGYQGENKEESNGLFYFGLALSIYTGVKYRHRFKELLTGRKTLFHGTDTVAGAGIRKQGLLGKHSAKEGSITASVLNTGMSNFKKKDIEDLVYLGSGLEANTYSVQAELMRLGNSLPAAQKTIAKNPLPVFLGTSKDKGDVIEFSIPAWKKEFKSVKVLNPEIVNYKDIDDFVKFKQKMNPLANKQQIKGLYKTLESASVYKRDIPTSFISGSDDFQRLSMGEFKDYVSQNPKQFGKGVLGFGALTTPLFMIPGTDDAYNTIEGLRHGGMAENVRYEHTDFGSGWRDGLLSFGHKVKNFFGGVKRSANLASTVAIEGMREVAHITKHQLLPGTMKLQPLETFVTAAGIGEILHFGSTLLSNNATLGGAALSGMSFVGMKYGYIAIKNRKNIKAAAMLIKENPETAKQMAIKGLKGVKQYIVEGNDVVENYIKTRGIKGKLGKEMAKVSAEEKLAAELGMSLEEFYTAQPAWKNALISVKGYNRIPGQDDAYNIIEGLRHGGMAEEIRKRFTDFGSGWCGILKNVFSIFKRKPSIPKLSKAGGFSRKEVVDLGRYAKHSSAEDALHILDNAITHRVAVAQEELFGRALGNKSSYGAFKKMRQVEENALHVKFQDVHRFKPLSAPKHGYTYNTIDGMHPGTKTGIGAQVIKWLTDFGSKYDALKGFARALSMTQDDLLKSTRFQKALAAGTDLGKLGEGGFGVTHKMRLEIEGHTLEYARKTISPTAIEKLGDIPPMMDIIKRSFPAETKALAAAGRKGVTPSLYGSGKETIFMELMAGTDAYQLSKQGTFMSDSLIEEAREEMLKLVKTGVHHQDIAHRNLMVDKTGTRIGLIDFGKVDVVSNPSDEWVRAATKNVNKQFDDVYKSKNRLRLRYGKTLLDAGAQIDPHAKTVLASNKVHSVTAYEKTFNPYDKTSLNPQYAKTDLGVSTHAATESMTKTPVPTSGVAGGVAARMKANREAKMAAMRQEQQLKDPRRAIRMEKFRKSSADAVGVGLRSAHKAGRRHGKFSSIRSS